MRSTRDRIRDLTEQLYRCDEELAYHRNTPEACRWLARRRELLGQLQRLEQQG